MTLNESYHEQHAQDLENRLLKIDGSARVAVLARAIRETELVQSDCGYGAGKRRAPIMETAVLLSHVIYMQPKGTIRPGWMWQGTAQIEEETGLWEHAIRKAREFAEELGWLETDYDRLKHRMFYRVLCDSEDFGELVATLLLGTEAKRDSRRNVGADKSRNVSAEHSRNSSADKSGTVSAERSRNVGAERSRTVSADGSLYRTDVSTHNTTDGRTNDSSSSRAGRAAEEEEKTVPVVDEEEQTTSSPGTKTLLEGTTVDTQSASENSTKEFYSALESDEPEIASCLPVLREIENWPSGPNEDRRTAEALRKYTSKFPDVDPKELCTLFADWHLDNPLKKNSNPRARLRTWFQKDREFGGRASRNRPSPGQVPLNGRRKGEAPVYGPGGAERESFAEYMRRNQIRASDKEDAQQEEKDG